jgi:hypothetical protein
MGHLKHFDRGATGRRGIPHSEDYVRNDVPFFGNELDEEVEDEEEHTEEDEEGAPGETAAGELGDGVDETGRDDAETGFPAAFVKGADGNIARKIAAKGGEFVVNPEGKFSAITPQEKSAKDKNGVAETRKKAESGT